MAKKIYYLENLHCAHCAAQIEDKINKLPQVESASLVFATGQLHVEAPSHEGLFPIMEAIVHDVEPEITFSAVRPGTHPVRQDCPAEHHHHDDCCDHEHHHHDDCCDHEHHHHDDCCNHEHHHHDDCCDHEHHHHDGCCCGHEHHESSENAVKKIYYLENLGCAHCAAKIEELAAALPQVESVSLAFAMKQLHVVSAHHNELLPLLQEIVHKVEPNASIQAHKPGSKTKKKIYMLENLGCAHCAAKIEERVAELPQVEEVSLVFTMKQLHVTAADHTGLLEVMQAIVHDVEPQAQITDPAAEQKEEKKTGPSRDTLEICAGAVLFLFGVALEHLLSLWWAPLIPFVISYLILGLPVLKVAGGNLLKGRMFDENFLMSIATLGAIIIGEYPEAVGVMLFFRIGEAFEAKAVARSRQEIMTAVDLRPETVTLSQTGITIPAEQAVVGDTLLVRPGDRIPLDGHVLEGESRINTAPITGEPVPVSVKPGDSVTSGCINQSGKLIIRVENTLETSMVTKILEAVETASASKPKIDRFISRFAKVYTPIVVVLALCTALIPSVITGNWSYWVYTAMSFLVMSCPCALVLSVPLAFFSGIGAGSKKGILFKGGLSMEAMSQVKVVAMDKTGTVTRGDFTVQNPDENLLQLCASCEQHSTHPIAQSIVAAAREKNLSLQEPESVEEIAGMGLRAVLAGKTLLCGNADLMKKYHISVPETAHQSGTLVMLACDGSFMGSLLVSDTLKPEAESAVKQLDSMGITTAMVTGDAKAPAEAVAKQVGIRKVFAKLLPQGKLDVLQNLRKEHGPVMFVGDGINDAPVLAGADVGAAMGSGADAAIEAADVVFMTSELDAVPKSIKISRRTRFIAWENVVFALAVKILVMILGLAGFANMWLAVFADTGVAMICVLNSIRILYSK